MGRPLRETKFRLLSSRAVSAGPRYTAWSGIDEFVDASSDLESLLADLADLCDGSDGGPPTTPTPPPPPPSPPSGPGGGGGVKAAPEPASLVLGGLGWSLLGIGGWWKRRRPSRPHGA